MLDRDTVREALVRAYEAGEESDPSDMAWLLHSPSMDDYVEELLDELFGN